jgi:hypothetical protein
VHCIPACISACINAIARHHSPTNAHNHVPPCTNHAAPCRPTPRWVPPPGAAGPALAEALLARYVLEPCDALLAAAAAAAAAPQKPLPSATAPAAVAAAAAASAAPSGVGAGSGPGGMSAMPAHVARLWQSAQLCKVVVDVAVCVRYCWLPKCVTLCTLNSFGWWLLWAWPAVSCCLFDMDGLILISLAT